MYLRPLLAGAVALAAAHPALSQGTMTPCWESNLGANLLLGDDQVSTQALGFSFPGPAGPVTRIDVSSNGFIWLGAGGNSGCCNGTGAALLSGMPRIAPLWTDLNPAAGGGVYFRSGTLAGNGFALVTWSQVPEFGGAGSVSMQLRLFSDGSFTMTWRPGSSIGTHTALTGVSQGNGASANAVDLSGVQTMPHFSGSNPTVYEEFGRQTFDLAGSSIAFTPNGQGGYIVVPRPNCGFAGTATFGTGCVDSPASYYENFPAGGFDLAGSATVSGGLQMFPTAQGTYAVLPGTGLWFPPGSNTLTMRDDSTVQQALPFPFPFQGGVTNDIWICSNGFIWLQSNLTAPYTPDVNALLGSDPRLCPLWTDLNPSATSTTGAGSVHYDVDPSGGTVYVTWNAVGEFGVQGASHTFQVALGQGGTIEFRYLTAGSQNRAMITGYSPGNGAPDPGTRDLSMSLPFATGNGGVPLVLEPVAGSRPVLGSTFNLEVRDAPAGSPLGFLAFGLQRLNPPLDLTALGMPTCFQYVTLDSGITFQVTGATTSIALPIPNNASLTGFVTYLQSAVVAPLATPLGLVASNGVELRVGL